jgi:hypothetical protein
METIQLTRKELYDLVWSTPLTKLSEKYSLTTEGIKKICKEFEIPTPDNGYWSKLKFKKEVKVEKLNKTFKGEDKIVLTKCEEGKKIMLDQSPLTILTKQIEVDKKAPLKVPERLSKPDILIQNTKDEFIKTKKDRYYYSDRKIDCVSISVEDKNIDRAFLIMDSFIKLLRYRGHTFRRDINNHGPHISVKDVDFPFCLREAQKRIPPIKKYDTSTYIFTGLFVIKIGESYRAIEWKDGSIKLENQLAKIVAKIELEADKELIWREECRIREIKRQEEEKARKEFEKRREIEIDKTKKLFSDAEKFGKAIIYRNYIEAFKQDAISKKNFTEEIKDWIDWANKKADWYDPFINKKDELLNDNDKEEIHSPKQIKKNYYGY